MGCVQSSNPTTPSSSSSGSTPSISKLTLTQDLNSYQDALKSDPNLQSFDTNLQYRTSRAINSLALEVEVKMLKKLQVQKGKVDKKMRNVETWRRLCNVIFVVTFSTVLICSVVAAAVSAPPLVTALAAAAAVPLGSMGKWVNSLWKKYETELKGQRELINAMRMGSFIVIKDLDNIKALVDKLGVEMEGLVRNAQFAISEEEEEAVGVAVDEMKASVNDFAKTIDELSDHSDKCCRDVRRARTVIVQKITKHPSGSV
nr:uncharacterized protein [Tanacetum cinerariifolium]